MIQPKVARIAKSSFLSSALLLAACGGGDSAKTGTLSLNVTDAPVDAAAEVVVAFTGVSIKPQSGPAFDIDFVDQDGNPVVKSHRPAGAARPQQRTAAAQP